MARRETAIWLIGFGWLACALGGFWLWERYDATPAQVGPEVHAATSTDRWRLSVFVHPQCPCTRATIREVAEIAAARPELAIHFLFVRPAGGPDGWERGHSWELAARIPGAEIACDLSGAEARRLGAKASGHAVLTDPAGTIVFRGGLTPARGRTGESGGRNAVLAWSDGRAGSGTAPVFGCDLFARDE